MKPEQLTHTILASFLALVPAILFFNEVLNYEPHTLGFWTLLSLPIFIADLVLLIISLFRRNRLQILIYCISVLIAGFFLYWSLKIPLCVVCDGLVGEDLGFLSIWISNAP